MEVPNRRPIKTRSMAWANRSAAYLAKSGLSPNQISMIGIGFAAIGALAMIGAEKWHAHSFLSGLLFLIAGVTVQLRLLCNMLDGLVAVEFGKKSKLGDLFNEVPDRIEDAFFLIAAGYATGSDTGMTLGWVAALLAIGTAYVRLLGGALGLKQDFCGPVAKPQRMFFLTVALAVATLQMWFTGDQNALFYALLLIIIGSILTLGKRLLRIVNALKAR